MLKTKFLLPAFVMVFILGLSNAAFAQLSCNVASTPVSRDTDTGLTEPAGDLIFNCTSGGTATTTATMTIDYGVPITNTTAWPSGTTGIRVANPTGFPGAGPVISSVVNSTGQVVISIPAHPGTPTTASFTLTGVLLALSGSGKSTVVANVSVSPGNGVLITAGQNNAVVVTSVLPGLKTPVLTPLTSSGLTLTPGLPIPTTGGILGGFSVNVPENYIDMYRSATQFNGGASTNGVRLTFTFTGVPAGLTFSGAAGSATTSCIASITSGTVSIVSTNSVVNSTTNTLTLEITGTPDLTALDTVTLACPFAVVSSTATLPFSPATITATVTLAPTGTAFSSTGAPLVSTTTGGNIPRYTSNPLPVPALTVASIIPATTDMLFPFVSIGGGFDTGFSVANTTGDPFGGTTNGGARAQSGTVTLYFFPQTGTPFCATTGGTATNPVTGGTGATTCSVLPAIGGGLASGGTVAAGTSWVFLGSDVLKNVTGAPATFTGYVFAVANFTNAHPSFFVADAAFSGKFSSGGPALVLAAPQVVPRTGLGGVEGLGH